jgi:hypothetical protein
MKDKNLKNDLIKIFIIAILFSLPLFIFKCINDDAMTHITRMYTLSISFKNGNFNPYIYQSCVHKYGYAYGIFYPDTFLKPFSFLIYLGLDIYTSFAIMLTLINLFTLLVPYILLLRIKTTRDNALLISLIYFLYPHRLYDYLIRFGVGQLFFYIAFPFILYGVYKMFKEEKFSFGLLIGFYLAVHSHILSIVFIIAFLVCFYIIKIKTIIRNKKIIKWTLINAILVLLTCIDVYLPILESLQVEDLYCEHVIGFGINIVDYILNVVNVSNITMAIGLIATIALLGIAIFHKNNIVKCIAFMVALLIVNTNLFPWQLILKVFPFINIIQFASRLNLYGVVPTTYLVYKLVLKLKLKISTDKMLLILELVITWLLATTLYSFDGNDIDDCIGAGEYLTYDEAYESLDTLDLFVQNPNRDTDITTKVYLSENGYLPIFYYHNYVIKDMDGNEYSYEKKDWLVYVEELKNDDIYVIVDYQNSFLQDFSYIVSIISCVGFGVFIIWKRKDLNNS